MRERPEAGRVHPVALVALGVLGVALIAVPWIRTPGPMPLEGKIEEGSAGYRRLLAVAAQTDGAVARGDLSALRERVTGDCWAEIERVTTETGRPLNSVTLREQRYLVGDLAIMPLVHGQAQGDVAVLVFEWGGRGAVGGALRRRSLFAVRFLWDGFDLRVDAKRSVALAAGDERTERAGAWAAELLK